ncbi:hypothetical protein ES703_92934 [subsurface metagenome]
MTGFNAFCKHYLYLSRLLKQWVSFRAYENTVLTSVAITSSVVSHPGATGAKCWYGLSPTSMINQVECTGDDTGWIATITSLATKTKYYLQWEGTAPDSMNTARSGIYTETTS